MTAILGALATFRTGTYRVTRSAAATYDAATGKPVDGAVLLTATFDAVVTPMSGRELQVLPENQRTQETRRVRTTYPLQTRTATSEPDVVTIDGEAWVIIMSNRVQFLGSTHYVAYAARRDPL